MAETRTQKTNSRRHDTYNNLKHEILHSDHVVEKDGTVVSCPRYNELKEDILKNEHDVLRDGTITQFIPVNTRYVISSLRGGTSYARADIHVPTKHLCPNGEIITFDVSKEDLLDNCRESGILYMDKDWARRLHPVRIGKKRINSTKYTPNGMQRVNRGHSQPVPGTKMLYPDGKIEVITDYPSYATILPDFLDSKKVYYPNGVEKQYKAERRM